MILSSHPTKSYTASKFLNLHKAINVGNKTKKTESFPFIVGEDFITVEVWKSLEFTAWNQIFLLTDRREREREKGGRERGKKKKGISLWGWLKIFPVVMYECESWTIKKDEC